MTNPRHAPPFRAIGVEGILRRVGDRSLVIIAPHPDDETLGCGGLIARAVRRDVGVAVIALTDGDASHPGSRRWPPAALGRLRAGEMRRALARLGAGSVAIRRLGWGDGRVAVDGDVRRLRRHLVALRAGVVLVTTDVDHHPDHRAAKKLALMATRGLDLDVVEYAVWSRVEGGRRGRNRHRGLKHWAMAAYRSQIDAYIADDQAGFRIAPAALASLVEGAELFATAKLGNRAPHDPRGGAPIPPRVPS